MALQSYLKARTDRPLVVGPQAERKAGEGTLEANLKEGEVFLKKGAQVYRLTWASLDTVRARPLPAGDYTLTGYRIVRGTWHLSATGSDAKLKIREGKATALSLDDTLRVKVHARRKGQELSLGMGIRGDKNAGLSVYRDGKRIPIGYQLSFQGEQPPAAGTMNYG